MAMTPAVVHGDVRFAGFSVLEFEQPAGHRVPRHFHEDTTLFCLVDGQAVDRIGTQRFVMDRGSILLRPAGAPHTHEYHRPLRALAVSIDAEAEMPTSPMLAVSPLLVGSFIEELSIVDAVQPLGVSAVVTEMISHVTARTSLRVRGVPAWLVRVRELLHDECEARLSLPTLADAAGVHPGHLARAFRLHFGTSVATYARERRLRQAARAIIRSQSTIVEIALQYGFCDQSHFDRAFRRRFGWSPSSFRTMFGLSKSRRRQRDSITT